LNSGDTVFNSSKLGYETKDEKREMKNQGFFKGKKITVVGLARSGVSCANLLHRIGARVGVTDACDTALTRAAASGLCSGDISLELGRHTREFIAGSDMLVVSPGVGPQSPAFSFAAQAGIPVIGEIEAAFLLCPAPVIAVTGSSGKTTVTTLIGEALKASGKKVFVCGNIGAPFCGEVEKISADDFVCLEVSSFQLETIRTFRPKVAVILNVSKNHLDRYNGMQEYLEAKKRIFLNQQEDDFLLLNPSDKLLMGLDKQARSRTVYFPSEEGLNPNQSAVKTAVSLLGINSAICAEVFRNFRGIEHRFELVGEKAGVKFINDSKATTAESALWALNNISGKVLLIAGGRDKGCDYSVIAEAARRKVKKALLIGEAKEAIRASLGGCVPVEYALDMPDAVRRAFQSASAGDYVLLSPMCSSFDMFTSYEERGRIFKAEFSALG